MERVVVFVCEHGAGRSRVAAALFAAAAPAGWRAASAGLRPQEQVSPHAAGLLGPTAAPLDTSPPQPLAQMPGDLVVAIDCDVAGARRWTLTTAWPEPQVGDELRALTAGLADELAVGGPVR
jgi:protein-tyrosine-phosphatase